MPEKGDWITVDADVPRWLPRPYVCAWVDLMLYFAHHPIRKLIILVIVNLTPTKLLLDRSDTLQDMADEMGDPKDALHMRMFALAHDLEMVTRACRQPNAGTESYRVRLQWRH